MAITALETPHALPNAVFDGTYTSRTTVSAEFMNLDALGG